MNIIYLIPRSGYVTDLRSDTLWGSICWGIRHLWGEQELTDFIKRCADGNPDFVISSAFPFKQHGKERIPFFPNPLLLSPTPADKDRSKVRDGYRLRKKLKAIQFLSLDDFKLMLHGNLTSSDLLERLRIEEERKKQALKDDIDYVPLPQTIEQTPPKRHDDSVTHNTIDRLRGGTLSVIDSDGNSAGQLFHADDIWWTDPDNESDESISNAGLYFLADGDISKLAPVLHLLRHWGIGADRTAGKGAFDFDIQAFTLPEPSVEQSNALLNLSLFRPDETELDSWEKSDGCRQYLLELREGFVGGYKGQRRKSARMYFREGSVFARPGQLNNKRFMGKVHAHKFDDLPHEVWDNGFGFMVNLNWKKQ